MKYIQWIRKDNEHLSGCEGNIQKEQQKDRCNCFNKESLEALIDIWCFQSIPILFTLKLIKIK